MNDAAIEAAHLKKEYGPDGLSFQVPQGAISGFLGPNGSGKTTTMRILMGFAHPTHGSASLLGVPAGSTHEIFRKVAFVPEIKDLYPGARAGEMIRLCSYEGTVASALDRYLGRIARRDAHHDHSLHRVRNDDRLRSEQ